MSGLKIVLPLSFTDTSLPVLRDDPILSSGSLMLIDPIHAADPWPAGVPANGAALPNIAHSEALTLLSISDEAVVKPVLTYPAGFSGVAGLLERTTKGGLHGISAQVGTVPQYSGPGIAFPAIIRNYVKDNPTHSFYLSYWGHLTRIVGSGSTYHLLAGVTGSGQQTNSFMALLNASTGVRPNASHTATYIGFRQPAINFAAGPLFATVGASAWLGPVPGDGTNVPVSGTDVTGGVYWGSTAQLAGISMNSGSNSGQQQFAPSHILYRTYLEDLTVSGRTYAAVDAIDNALYTAAVTAGGGRYQGDTYTDPTTLP